MLKRSVSDALEGLRRNLVTTVAAVLTVAVSLTLLGAALLVRSEIALMREYFYTQVEVSVFLRDDVTQQQRDALRAELDALPVVDEVIYESKDEAFRRFQLQFKDSPDFLAVVTRDALPESYRVALTDPRRYDEVAAAVRDRPGVEDVVDQRALLDQVFGVLDGLRNAALVLAAVVLAAAMLLISNVVRVSAYNRRREITLMRLIGASKTSIQLPFVLEGLVTGLIGAAGAAVLLAATKVLLLDRTLATLFSTGVLPAITWGRLLGVVPLVLLASLVISGAASYVTTRRYVSA